MNSKFTSRVLFLLTILSVNQLKAGHFADMEIFYRWVSDSTYEFTAVYNRNCSGFGAAAPNTITIQATNSSTTAFSTFLCSKLPTTGPGVPPLIIPNLFNCINNSVFCTEEHVYRGTWTSPYKAVDWTFSYGVCCLPAGALGPTNVAPNSLFTDCGLNNLDFPDSLNKNNSPFWHNMRPNHPNYPGDTLNNPPHISMCEARQQNLDQSTKEYDNDYVKYEFVAPLATATTPLAYANGWSLTNLMPSYTGPLTIDSLTGAIDFIPGAPTGSGIYLITIKATEYRNDTVTGGPTPTVVQKEIGFVKRNLFVYLNDSASCPGASMSYSDTTGMATSQRIFNCPEQSFEVRFTDNFMCSSLDTNGSDILMRHVSSNTIIPIEKVISSGCNSAQTSDRFVVYIDTVLQADTFELMIKQGVDSNTLLTECQFQLEPYADTLLLIFQEQQIGELQGDKLGPGMFDTKIELECGDLIFDLNLSEPVSCNSIANDGSDFELYNMSTSAVIPVTGVGKNCNNGKTKSLQLSTNTMDPGNYWLRLKQGSDTNTLENLCGEEWFKDSILLVSTGLYPNLGKDTAKCEDDTTFNYFLNPGQFFSYYWSTGNTAPSIFISVPTTYWVEVKNVHGCTATDTMVLSVKDCYVGLNEESEEKLDIYPNPASSVVYIKSDQLIKPENVELFSVVGEKIAFKSSAANSTLELDISSLNDGVYFVKIQTNNQSFISKKIVVKKN